MYCVYTYRKYFTNPYNKLLDEDWDTSLQNEANKL